MPQSVPYVVATISTSMLALCDPVFGTLQRTRRSILRKLARMDQTQRDLFGLFGLEAFAPREGTTAKWAGI